MMLDALVKEASQYEAIVVYSLYMLPNKTEKRMKIYQETLAAGAELHFAFEELAIRKMSDVQLVEDILLTKNLSRSITSEWETLCR